MEDKKVIFVRGITDLVHEVRGTGPLGRFQLVPSCYEICETIQADALATTTQSGRASIRVNISAVSKGKSGPSWQGIIP